MARRPNTRCTRCSRLATNKGRCDEHQPKPWATKSANSRALTGRQRSDLRERAIAHHPFCGVCDEDDVTILELDHIVEVADGGAALDPANTWLLCVPCHKVKTKAAREARNLRKKLA